MAQTEHLNLKKKHKFEGFLQLLPELTSAGGAKIRQI
jgi:hypothetical protein